jgi:hypothetical protein
MPLRSVRILLMRNGEGYAVVVCFHGMQDEEVVGNPGGSNTSGKSNAVVARPSSLVATQIHGTHQGVVKLTRMIYAPSAAL